MAELRVLNTADFLENNADTMYSVDDIIGKSLYAARPLTGGYSVGRNDLSFKQGQLIGQVYSYIGGNGTPLYWMFLDDQNKPFYVEHQQGNFSITALKEQGAVTVKEKAKQEEEKSKSIGDKLGDQLLNFVGAAKFLLIIAIIALLVIYLKKYYEK